MKEIKLQIDGQEITAHVDENELAKLIKPERARTGYEQVKLGEHFYTSSHEPGHSPQITRCRSATYNVLFKRGDYINDEHLFFDRDRARVLRDRLEQWQALNDEPVDWGNSKEKVWYIEYDYTAQSIIACYTLSVRPVGTLGFSTHEKAQEAIDVFRDELMWYYTEYRSRLDEPERKEYK